MSDTNATRVDLLRAVLELYGLEVKEASPAPTQKHWALISPGLADRYRRIARAACEVLELNHEETSPDDILEAVLAFQKVTAVRWNLIDHSNERDGSRDGDQLLLTGSGVFVGHWKSSEDRYVTTSPSGAEEMVCPTHWMRVPWGGAR